MHTDDNRMKNKSRDKALDIDNNDNIDVDQDFYGYDDFNTDSNEEVENKKNNNGKKIIFIVIIVLILLASLGVIVYFLTRDNNEEPPVLTPGIVLSDPDIELVVGSSQKLTYTVENYTGNISVTWSSSDKSVVTIDKNGTIKGVKAGTAIITATYSIDGVEYTKTSNVTIVKKATVPTVTLSKTKLELNVGSSQKLTYTVKNNTSSISITWSSSNKSVATVDKNGNVKGVKAGTATITATYTYNGTKYKKTCSVTVKQSSSTETPPTVTLSKTSLELNVGSSQKLTYTVKNNSSNVSITWSSNNTSIATVDKSGNVKGVKAGTTTIVLSYTYNGVKYNKNCTVTVKGSSSTGTTTDKTSPSLSYTVTSGKENSWVNTNVSIKVSASDDSGSVTLKYTRNCSSNCTYTTISSNTITVSNTGSSVITIVATDKSGNTTSKNVTVKIDKTKPSCSLKVSETGTLSASYSDSGGSSIAYYGFSSSGSSSTSKTISSAGTYNYYVRDMAGNSNTCSLAVKTKTQYRYQECASCKRCSNAGCQYFSGWTAVGSGSITSVNDAYVDIYEKRVCNSYTTGLYKCQSYERTCTTYHESCDKCGGCSTWSSEYSSWSDTAYANSSSRKVETKTVYYS